MTLYALVQSDDLTQTGALPHLWHDGTRWWDFRTDPDPALLASLGWHPVTLTPRPADTATDTYVEDVALVDGLPVQTWTPRPWTVDELAARAEQAAADAKAAEDRAILDAIAHTSASAHADGETWTAPTGAHDAYALGVTVKHAGKTWVNLTPANVWQPGNTADPQSYRWWREVVADPGPGTPAWDGNGHAYKVGDLVTYQGLTYQVLQAHTSQPGWTPNIVPALYKVVP